MFFKKKKVKFTELFTRVKHEKFGEGFIFAYSDNNNMRIGVKFINPNPNDLGALLPQFIKRGYPTKSDSGWFSDWQLEEIKNFDYENFVHER